MPRDFAATGDRRKTARRVPSWKDDSDYWVADLEERSLPDREPDLAPKWSPVRETEPKERKTPGDVVDSEQATEKDNPTVSGLYNDDRMAQPPLHDATHFGDISETSFDPRQDSLTSSSSSTVLPAENSFDEIAESQLDSPDLELGNWEGQNAKPGRSTVLENSGRKSVNRATTLLRMDLCIIHVFSVEVQ